MILDDALLINNSLFCPHINTTTLVQKNYFKKRVTECPDDFYNGLRDEKAEFPFHEPYYAQALILNLVHHTFASRKD